MPGELSARLTQTALGLALLLSLGFAIAIIFATLHTIRKLSKPPRRSYAWAVSKGLPGDPSELITTQNNDIQSQNQSTYSEWSFTSRGNMLPVWDIIGHAPNAPILIFTHGWGESRTTSLERAQALLPLVSRLILWDMPAHGDATGKSSLGAQEPTDLAELISTINTSASPQDQSLSQPNQKPKPIVLMGFSLGAGVSIAAAASKQYAVHQNQTIIGVIAEAPYRVPITPARAVLSAAAMPWRINLPAAMAILGLRSNQGLSWARTTTAKQFDRAELAKQLSIPILVIHGQLDTISPPQDGKDIAEAAQNGTYTPITNAAHLDIWRQPHARSAALNAITAFLDSVNK